MYIKVNATGNIHRVQRTIDGTEAHVYTPELEVFHIGETCTVFNLTKVTISDKLCFWDGINLFLDEQCTFPVSLDALTDNQRQQLIDQL